MCVLTVLSERVSFWSSVVIITDLLKLPSGGIIIVSVYPAFCMRDLRYRIRLPCNRNLGHLDYSMPCCICQAALIQFHFRLHPVEAGNARALFLRRQSCGFAELGIMPRELIDLFLRLSAPLLVARRRSLFHCMKKPRRLSVRFSNIRIELEFASDVECRVEFIIRADHCDVSLRRVIRADQTAVNVN